MSDILIRLRDVTIGYGHPLLPPLSLELRRGEFWGVVGPNGAGKTTLARTMLGLLPPISGKVERLVSDLRPSYTPQRHRLNPNYPLTVLDVVLMGRAAHLPPGRRPTQEDHRYAQEALSRLDCGTLAGRLFRSLSGGQQQRVLLARALAVLPDLLVLDEPAEGMDLLAAHDILRVLREVNEDHRVTVLMINHRLDDVVSVADHICFINQHAGLFEAGAVDTMASTEKLTSLYGRPVSTHMCAGRTHVRVGEG